MKSAPQDVPTDPPPASNTLGYVGLALVIALYLIHVRIFWHYVNDDAYITFRYSRFLATCHGPYFNLGEHVEGYTNFLLMLLLAPVFSIGGESAVPIAAKLIGIASGIVCMVTV